MTIESPSTYAEWFWSHNVQAVEKADEDIESAFAPYFAGLFGDIQYLSELPEGMQTFVRALAEPPSAGFGGFALGVGVEMVDELLHSAMSPAMKMLARTINKSALETWLTSEQASTLFSRGKITEGLWTETVRSEGYEDVLGKFLYQSQLPYPTIPEIMRYARYSGEPDNIREAVWDKFDVPVDDFDLWEFQTRQFLSTADVHTAYRREVIDGNRYFTELARLGWRFDDRDIAEQIGWTIPNAMLLVQGNLVQGIDHDKIIDDISRADIHPDYAQLYLDGVLTKPASTDIIAYLLRQDATLSDLDQQLTRIGIHPDYIKVYKELAYQIPPVADIITMAVREAFTPEIAARFGQYDDFPPAFAEYAAKKGLTKEWAERYWASHWSLPSAQQGFEMLQRGVINYDELNMLLRALDVMPFWRDRLTQIAFRRLTRVDVRRMYRVGVLDEAGVYDAYLELGYNERDARRMTDFTVQQTLTTLSKFTTSDIVKAYTKRMIDRAEARSLLTILKVSGSDADFILSTADYKRQWEFTDSQISGIRNLYKKQVYDNNKARGELLKLGLPTEQVSVLMQQWFYEAKETAPRTWTLAQTLGFMQDGLITRDRARTELKIMGYDDEHIDVYMRSIK